MYGSPKLISETQDVCALVSRINKGMYIATTRSDDFCVAIVQSQNTASLNRRHFTRRMIQSFPALGITAALLPNFCKPFSRLLTRLLTRPSAQSRPSICSDFPSCTSYKDSDFLFGVSSAAWNSTFETLNWLASPEHFSLAQQFFKSLSDKEDNRSVFNIPGSKYGWTYIWRYSVPSRVTEYL